MRKFVAACCCVIVGMEVLIGVPLVVCVFAFAYMEAAGTTVTVQSQPVDFPSLVNNPAVIPPPSYSSDYASRPAPVPTVSWSAPDGTARPPAPTVCPPPPSLEATAIAEVRQQNGSPLDGTLVAPNNPAGAPSIEPFVAAVENVAAQETACLLPPPPTAPEQPVAAVNPLEPSAAPQAAQPDVVVSALRTCSEQLYQKANDLEAGGNYGRADDVRRLARRIREEIDTLGRESPSSPPVPSTVTAASFDPRAADATAAATEPEPATRKSSLPVPDPTVPSALRPSSSEPPVSLTVQPRIVIEDEEALLPLEQKEPANPTP